MSILIGKMSANIFRKILSDIKLLILKLNLMFFKMISRVANTELLLSIEKKATFRLGNFHLSWITDTNCLLMLFMAIIWAFGKKNRMRKHLNRDNYSALGKDVLDRLKGIWNDEDFLVGTMWELKIKKNAKILD